VTSVAGAGPRLVGVNIDILDSSNNVVLSDTFSGVLGSFAVSRFDGTLAPGAYRLVATGTAQAIASLDMSISFAQNVRAPAASLASVVVETNTLVNSNTVPGPLFATDTLFLNTLVTTETGALNQRAWSSTSAQA